MNYKIYIYSAIVALLLTGCPSGNIKEKGDLRAIEHDRIDAILNKDWEIANDLHADDFEMYAADGSIYDKNEFLGKLTSGIIRYEVWQPSEIDVRLYEEVAVLHYSDSDILVYIDKVPYRRNGVAHTLIYEKRDGDWVLVWAHESGGKSR